MVSIKNFRKKYGDFEVNLSLDIPKGSYIGLVGKNGHGKSTTIKAILGLITPDGGTILIDGKNPYELTPTDKQKIGVVLSDSCFSREFTLKDVCDILKAMYPDFRKNWFLNECKKNNLDEKKKIQEYSTGMRAKLKILTALSHKTKLLILDEPTAGLDVEARTDIIKMVKRYLEEDITRTLIITSHISTDLEQLCDTLYLINNGKIIFTENTDALLGDYGMFKVNDETFRNMKQNFIISAKHESYGYCCFTNNKQFYASRYPDLVIEKGNIDDLVLLLASKEVGM